MRVERLAVPVCLVVALAGRLAYLRHPWDGDAGMFVCCGRAVAGGARFCHDIYDNKFPTAALWSALWWRACGLFWPAYVVGGAVMAFATAGVLWATVKRHAGRTAATATLLFALVYLNFCPVVFGGFQSETALTMFATLAAAFAVEALANGRATPAFTCGLAAGVAAYLKPTGLAPVAVFALIALHQLVIRERSLRAIGWQACALLVGVMIPIGGAVVYLHAADILRDMPWLYRQISAYASQSVRDRYTVIKLVTAVGFVALPLWMRFRSGSGQKGMSAPPRDRRTPHPQPLSPEYKGEGSLILVRFALLWLGLEFAAVAMQGRMYAYHFLVIAAPASVLFGVIARPTTFRSTVLPILPAIFFSLWGVGWQIIRPEVKRLPVSDYLAAHAAPGDAVWMDNMCRLLLETDLAPGTRYFQTFAFFNTDRAPLEMGPLLIEDLKERRPRFVVLPTDPVTAVDLHCAYMAELAERPIRRANFKAAWMNAVAYVRGHYEVAAEVGDRTIYVRKRGELSASGVVLLGE